MFVVISVQTTGLSNTAQPLEVAVACLKAVKGAQTTYHKMEFKHSDTKQWYVDFDPSKPIDDVAAKIHNANKLLVELQLLKSYNMPILNKHAVDMSMKRFILDFFGNPEQLMFRNVLLCAEGAEWQRFALEAFFPETFKLLTNYTLDIHAISHIESALLGVDKSKMARQGFTRSSQKVDQQLHHLLRFLPGLDYLPF